MGGAIPALHPQCGATCLLTHVAVFPSPAWGTLALVRSSADTSIKTRLGADGWVHLKGELRTGLSARPQHHPVPLMKASSPSLTHLHR